MTDNLQLGEYLDSPQGSVRTLTPHDADIDSLIEPIIVLSGNRDRTEQEQLHPYFWPVTGRWRMRDLHKTFVDEESYNSGHGHCYQHFGIDPEKGAVLIVRPDNYVSKITTLEDHDGIGSFFTGFIKKPAQINRSAKG
jgi:phenol 2-monooxygenase (NADPH)